jgi:glucokinase
VGQRGLVLVADIGATKTLVGVCDAAALPGSWILEAAERFATPVTPESATERVVAAAARLATEAGGTLLAAGIAAPGPLDPGSGRIDFSPNLAWRDVPLGPWLTDELGVPVRLEDDASAAALGEARFGAGQGADPFAYLTVSSGVGSGIVVGGRLVRGAHGIAGEVGHLAVRPDDGPRCACGRRGDVEALAGGASIARRARAAWGRRLPGGRTPPRDAAGVFALARAGDPVAAALVEDAAEGVARAIAALAAILDPGVIAIGGSLALGQPWLRRRAVVLARRRVMVETGRALLVRSAWLGEASCLAGAAAVAGDLLAG